MDEKLADRDRLWCRALVATLGIDEIARVTAEFNRIRPDTAQQSVHPTPLTLFGMKVEIANWLNPGQWFIRPSRRG